VFIEISIFHRQVLRSVRRHRYIAVVCSHARECSSRHSSTRTGTAPWRRRGRNNGCPRAVVLYRRSPWSWARNGATRARERSWICWRWTPTSFAGVRYVLSRESAGLHADALPARSFRVSVNQLAKSFYIESVKKEIVLNAREHR